MDKMKATAEMAATMAAARAGDPLARRAEQDLHEEMGGQLSPYLDGRCYLIQMTTLYYIGRVVAQGPGWLILADASWVHWTGRLSTLLSRLSFGASGWPSGHQRPRTERCPRPVIIHWGQQGAASHEWPAALPGESIQS